MAQHRCLNFGAVSAVMGWNAFGEFTSHVLRKHGKVVVARYVDDFFGVTRQNLLWPSNKMCELLHRLIGAPCDKKKALYSITRLVLLGSEIFIRGAAKAFAVRLEQKKAGKYIKMIEEILASNTLPSGIAMKLVGKLSFACTASRQKSGRAYLRPLYRQTNDPYPGLTWWVSLSLQWWKEYLSSSALRWTTIGEVRRTIHTYSDASGVDRWVAAAIRISCPNNPIPDRWFWTRWQLSEQIWNLFLDRNDLNIGLQELVALCLAAQTFEKWIQGANWLAWCDNQGCTCAVLKGGSKAADSNMIIGKLWLLLAEWSTWLHVYQVASASNLGDGPTRYSLDQLEYLGAQWIEPKLPTFLTTIWAGPTVSEISDLVRGSDFSPWVDDTDEPLSSSEPVHDEADFAEVAGTGMA